MAWWTLYICSQPLSTKITMLTAGIVVAVLLRSSAWCALIGIHYNTWHTVTKWVACMLSNSILPRERSPIGYQSTFEDPWTMSYKSYPKKWIPNIINSFMKENTHSYTMRKYVTCRAKTNLVHTSDFTKLIPHKICHESHTKLKFSTIIQ